MIGMKHLAERLSTISALIVKHCANSISVNSHAVIIPSLPGFRNGLN